MGRLICLQSHEHQQPAQHLGWGGHLSLRFQTLKAEGCLAIVDTVMSPLGNLVTCSRLFIACAFCSTQGLPGLDGEKGVFGQKVSPTRKM